MANCLLKMKSQTIALFSTSNNLEGIKYNLCHKHPKKKHTVKLNKFKMLSEADQQIKNILSDFLSLISSKDKGDIDKSTILQIKKDESNIVHCTIPKIYSSKRKNIRNSFVHKSSKISHIIDLNFSLINDFNLTKSKIKPIASTILKKLSDKTIKLTKNSFQENISNSSKHISKRDFSPIKTFREIVIRKNKANKKVKDDISSMIPSIAQN